jgi:hypothetical protein
LVIQVTASAEDETKSLSVKTMASIGRKKWNFVTGITSDSKLNTANL